MKMREPGDGDAYKAFWEGVRWMLKVIIVGALLFVIPYFLAAGLSNVCH